MVQDTTFWDRAAPKYVASPIKDMNAYEATMDRTRSYLSKDHSVLEIGCGSGNTALLLAPHVGRMTASDISAEMFRLGRQRAKDEGVNNIDFLQAPVQDPSVAYGSYDVVTAFNLLHLCTDLPAAVDWVHGRLKPSGLFISKTPCIGERMNYLRPVIWAMRLVGKAPYVNFLKVTALENALTEAGFHIIETGDYPKKTPGHFVVARRD